MYVFSTIGLFGRPAGKIANNGIWRDPPSDSSRSPIFGSRSPQSATSVTTFWLSTISLTDFVFRTNCSRVLQVSHQSAVKSTNTVFCPAVSFEILSKLNDSHGNS